MNVVRWWNTARIRNLVASEMAKSLFWLNQENETAAVMEYVPSSEMTVADPGSRLALGKKEGERLDADLSAWSETNDGRQTLKPVAPAFLAPEGKPLMFMGGAEEGVARAAGSEQSSASVWRTTSLSLSTSH